MTADTAAPSSPGSGTVTTWYAKSPEETAKAFGVSGRHRSDRRRGGPTTFGERSATRCRPRSRRLPGIGSWPNTAATCS